MQLPNKFLCDYKRLLRLLNSGAVFCAVDTETTGLSVAQSRVIELGAVLFDSSGVLDTFSSLINPCCEIPAGATSVHHITNEMVACAPSAKTVLSDFVNFAKDAILVAHNARFDLRFINNELELCGMDALKNKAIDTLALSRWAYPAAERHNLQYLARAMGIDVESAHRAYDDAKVCRHVFLRCLKDTEAVQKK